MKHNTHELTGALLDQAVAKALGLVYDRAIDVDVVTGPEGLRFYSQCRAVVDGQLVVFSPSTRWDQGGPIIERERISPLAERHMNEWLAVVGGSQTYDGFEGDFEVPGSTPLIAAMRAFVLSKLGEEVELP